MAGAIFRVRGRGCGSTIEADAAKIGIEMDASGEVNEAVTQGRDGDGTITDLQVFVTAGEAYPAFERAFLNAESEISASFRLFDLTTKLHSDEARELGDTWFDLMIDTLNRGVAIRIVVTDFDPVAAPDLHQLAWQTKRQMVAVQELANDDAKLEFTIALHDAKAGLVPKMVFFPFVRQKMRELNSSWLEMNGDERARFRSETPRLRHICYEDDNGTLCFPVQLVDLYPATHHQKMAVFDRRLLYIGGLDVNDRRYDTRRHRRAPERTWHDVQVMATGSVVEAAQTHLDTFLDTVAAKSPPPPAAPGFLRTLSRRRHRASFRVSPKPVVRELEKRHLVAVRRSNQFIYLETQFLRFQPLARALAKRARQCPDLKLFVVMPAAPEDIAFDSNNGLDARFGEDQQIKCLTRLRQAFGEDRLLVTAPVQPRRQESDERDVLEDAPLIYVHSKVSIFDDFGAIVSSANLNGRSLRWDTETGLWFDRPEHIELVRKRVMGNWLPSSGAGDEFLDPSTAFEHWKRLVDENTDLPPEKRRGFLVHYDSDAAREFALPVPGMPEEIV
ncbi:MAG: phospholipase D family protein [Roseovarius sp.]|uniref:phospholipase D family protein n=2 Tax=Roseovarius sp. TaxID=1486281 RepID=UPI0032F04CE4